MLTLIYKFKVISSCRKYENLCELPFYRLISEKENGIKNDGEKNFVKWYFIKNHQNYSAPKFESDRANLK